MNLDKFLGCIFGVSVGFDAVHDVIGAGGDTDSNASIVGSLSNAPFGAFFCEVLYNRREDISYIKPVW